MNPCLPEGSMLKMKSGKPDFYLLISKCMKYFLLMSAWLMVMVVQAQTPVLTASYREWQYDFGAIDSSVAENLSESEKIMQALKFQDRRHVFTLYSDGEWMEEVMTDSNEYEQDWMKLSKHYRYGSNGIELLDKDGKILQQFPYTEDQKDYRKERSQYIKEFGYHPGILHLPDFSLLSASQLNDKGLKLEVLPGGNQKLRSADKTISIDYALNVIKEEFVDKEGRASTFTYCYEPMESGEGLLLRLKKTEKRVNTEKGQCYIQTQIQVYKDYKIDDAQGMMRKQLQTMGYLKLYPNPNGGVFTIEALLNPGDALQSIVIIHQLSGDITNITPGNGKIVSIDKPNLTPGNYAIKAVTRQGKKLSAHFIKN